MNPQAPTHSWLPLAALHELHDSVPLACSHLGQALVLWRQGQAVSVFSDRCPHRGARLSLGTVREGQLECPYHGWRFEGSGQCVAIPALPAFVPPAGHRVACWQVLAAHGLWWAAPPGSSDSGPPLLDDLPRRRLLCGPYEVATSAPRVVENFLDTAHFGIVHEGGLGSREHLEVPDYRVSHDEFGRPGVALYRAWQPQASASAAGGGWVDYRYQVLSPYSALLEKRAEGTMPREAYALWSAPLEADRCHVWFTIFSDSDTPDDAAMIRFQDAVFQQDRPILESQSPRLLPLSGGELSCAADRLSAAYRRWLQTMGLPYGCC